MQERLSFDDVSLVISILAKSCLIASKSAIFSFSAPKGSSLSSLSITKMMYSLGSRGYAERPSKPKVVFVRKLSVSAYWQGRTYDWGGGGLGSETCICVHVCIYFTFDCASVCASLWSSRYFWTERYQFHFWSHIGVWSLWSLRYFACSGAVHHHCFAINWSELTDIKGGRFVAEIHE